MEKKKKKKMMMPRKKLMEKKLERNAYVNNTRMKLQHPIVQDFKEKLLKSASKKLVDVQVVGK